MIRLSNVVYTTKKRQILKNISLEVQASEMVFLTGPSGAGKTSLLKLISGLDRRFDGELLVDKLNIKKLNDKDIILFQNNIGKILSTPLLLDELSVEENLAIPLEILGYSKDKIHKKVLSISKLFKVQHLLPQNTNELSQGEQQIVNIVRAIINRPAILLADEPTSNLDDTLATNVISTLEAFQRLGITIIIATHDLRLIGQFKKRTIILKDGSLAADVPPVDTTHIRSIYSKVLQI